MPAAPRRGVALRDGGREVQAAVPGIRDAPRRRRQVGHVVQREAQVRGDVARPALRQGPAGVLDRLEDPGCHALELREVVVLRAHQAAQGDIGAPGLFGRGGALLAEAFDLGLQREHRGERFVGHRPPHAEGSDTERLEGLTAHRPLDRELQGGAGVEGLGIQQLVELALQRAGDRLQLRELRLAAAVLDHRHLAGRAPDRGGEVVERHAPRGAQLPDAAADGEGVHLPIVEREGCRGSGDAGVHTRGSHENRRSRDLHRMNTGSVRVSSPTVVVTGHRRPATRRRTT